MEKSQRRLVFFLSAIASITLLAVVILTTIAYQIGVERLEEDNRVTMNSGLLSGILSLGGGIVGAFGAFYVATNQMHKQFKNQDRNRSLEIKIDKSNQALNTLYELKNLIFTLYSEKIVPLKKELITTEIESAFEEIMVSKKILVNKKYLIEEDSDVEKILELNKQIEQIKIFIKNEIDYSQFNYCVDKFIREYRKFINLNWEFDNWIFVSNEDLKSKLFSFTLEIDGEYVKFFEVIENHIRKIEEYITTVLN